MTAQSTNFSRPLIAHSSFSYLLHYLFPTQNPKSPTGLRISVGLLPFRLFSKPLLRGRSQKQLKSVRVVLQPPKKPQKRAAKLKKERQPFVKRARRLLKLKLKRRQHRRARQFALKRQQHHVNLRVPHRPHKPKLAVEWQKHHRATPRNHQKLQNLKVVKREPAHGVVRRQPPLFAQFQKVQKQQPLLLPQLNKPKRQNHLQNLLPKRQPPRGLLVRHLWRA